MSNVYLVIKKAKQDSISPDEWRNLVFLDPELEFSTTDTLDCIRPDGEAYTIHAVHWAGDPDSSFILHNGEIHVEGEADSLLEKARSIARQLNAVVVNTW